jgi:hypothetical protein
MELPVPDVWLADLARPHLGDDPIEVGAGIGDYAAEWLTTAPRITVTEADDLLLRAYDRLVVPLARRLERYGRPPFGQSVLAVARRPTAA